MHFTNFVNLYKLSVSKQLHFYNYKRDANNYQQEKKTPVFYKIIHFSVQFSAKVNRFIVKT